MAAWRRAAGTAENPEKPQETLQGNRGQPEKAYENLNTLENLSKPKKQTKKA